MDAAFWQQVERARRMTGDERFREGLALFDRALRLMSDGIRHQFPQATPTEIAAIRRERLAINRACESSR
jgi:hypothetical protein